MDESELDERAGEAGHAGDSSAPAGPLLHVVLDRPAIAGNVGACARLVAAAGAALHVCGSTLDPGDRELWRAGLDYWVHADVRFHRSLARCLALLPPSPFVVEVGGRRAPWDAALTRGSVVVLGPENGSVDDVVLAPARRDDRVLTLPMVAGRSLNLAQVAAVVVFEAARQQQR